MCSGGFRFGISSETINTMTSDHEKLFKLVCKGDVAGVAKYLRANVVDLNALSDGGWSPLMWACDGECFEMVRLLVENGADVNQRAAQGWGPLHLAVSTSIDSDCKHKLGRRVDEAPVDIVVYLLWKGADPLARTDEGQTAADIAREVSSDKLADLLERFEMSYKKGVGGN
jgi:ankyrin repeat protein